MFHLDHTPGRMITIEGKEYLFFSGYSYLGMNHVPEFNELIKEGGEKYGWLFPSSRISNTQLDLYGALESKLSEITGTERSVCFSSGFLAGQAVMEVLENKGVDFHIAPNTHPAIYGERSERITFPEWTESVVPTIKENDVLAFDSVNPLLAEVNDPSFLQNITQRITCVIDDSHGIGLLNGGKGVAASLPQKENISYIITYSLSKAFGIIGGGVSCSAAFAEQLKTSPFFTASTSLSPAFVYAFLKGQHLYESQRKKLENNTSLFNTLSKHQFSSTEKLPIFLLPEAFSEEILKEAGIIISSFPYPDPSGEKVNRVVLNALHTENDLQKLANALL